MEERIKLMLGDNMKSLKELPDNSVDSIVTDPPYALTSIKKRFGKEGSAPAQYGSDGAFQRASKGFMGKEWDAEVPTVEFWCEVYRVLKPGGHVLSFGGTRTYHRMAVNIEDAGFEIRDQIMWIYGSGFPKSHNIGKAIDKIQGKEVPTGKGFNVAGQGIGLNQNKELRSDHPNYVKPTYDNEWEGWGTALKPANEPICMARKPLSEKTIAENVLKWGTGGLNIDASRIGTDDYIGRKGNDNDLGVGILAQFDGRKTPPTKKAIDKEGHEEGRFPANVILDEEAGKILDEQSGVKKSGFNPNASKKQYNGGTFGGGETNSNNGYGDEGGASRFFYVPKVSKKERNRGLDDFEDKPSQLNSGGIGRKISVEKRLNANGENAPTAKNTHPTVKPINLLTYLVRLVTPKNGVVMDCFMGSGSTGIAAQLEGFKFIGMEMDEDYFNIAEARINAYEEYRELLK
jgi:site-specific DNA-methyltransferase (adenine-specific)